MVDLRTNSLEKLATRIPERKTNPFNVEALEVVYDGSYLTSFLSKHNSNKTIRHSLLISRIGTVFDLLEGDILLV